MGFEPHSPEFEVASLEAREAMFFALIESKVAAGASQAGKAEPLLLWNGIQRGVETEHMESCEQIFHSQDSIKDLGTYRNHSRRKAAFLRHDFSCGKFHRIAVADLLTMFNLPIT